MCAAYRQAVQEIHGKKPQKRSEPSVRVRRRAWFSARAAQSGAPCSFQRGAETAPIKNAGGTALTVPLCVFAAARLSGDRRWRGSTSGSVCRRRGRRSFFSRTRPLYRRGADGKTARAPLRTDRLAMRPCPRRRLQRCSFLLILRITRRTAGENFSQTA